MDKIVHPDPRLEAQIQNGSVTSPLPLHDDGEVIPELERSSRLGMARSKGSIDTKFRLSVGDQETAVNVKHPPTGLLQEI